MGTQRILSVLQNLPGIAQGIVGVAGRIAVQNRRIVNAVVVQVADRFAASVGDLVGKVAEIWVEHLSRTGAGDTEQYLDDIAGAAGNGAAGYGAGHLLG